MIERITYAALSLWHAAQVCALRLCSIGTRRQRYALLGTVIITVLLQLFILTRYSVRHPFSIVGSELFTEASNEGGSFTSVSNLKEISTRLDSMRLYESHSTIFIWMIILLSLCCSTLVAAIVVSVLFRRLNGLHTNLAAISHDLKGPLTSAEGYIESVLIKMEKSPHPDVLSDLHTALRSIQSAGSLVNDLHYVSKLEASGNVTLREPFNVIDLTLDTLEGLRHRFSDKSVSLSGHIPDHLDFVCGDISLAERLLRNILENALRYTDSGGSVCVSVSQTDDYVFTTISDTGCGIAKDEIANIFQSNFRGSNAGNIPEGSGLGLAVASRIAALHQTTINVSSEVGVGTTVSWGLKRANPASNRGRTPLFSEMMGPRRTVPPT